MGNTESKFELMVRESGLDKTKAQYLLDNFTEYFAIASDWENKAKTLAVTDENQTAVMKMAREGRLFLQSKRVDIEKARKDLKDQSLREGKAIDGIANVLKALIIPIENYLRDQENFVVNKQKAEVAERQRLALELLRKQEEEKAEIDRKAREAEQNRLRLENERLKKERQATETKAMMEKMKQDKIREKERKLAEEKLATERERSRIEAEKIRVENEKKLAEERKKAKEEAEKLRIENEKKMLAEKSRLDKLKKKEEAKLKAEREELKRKHEEELRQARLVKCPKCGHEFENIK